MDIFLSYRRSVRGDTMQAGRLCDYLRATLRLEVYYDRSEQSNPTGPQFPETLRKALDACRIVVALINRDWVDRIAALGNPADWVHAELLRAHPSQGKVFVPIYLDATPDELAGKLPPALEFVASSNSQLLWRAFEDAEKAALKAVLAPYLPATVVPDRFADTSRLELLCDRTHPEDCFRHAIERQAGRGIGTGWLLFGEREQAAGEMFERIRIFTLKSRPGSQTIQLELQDMEPDADVVVQTMLKKTASALSITRPASLEELPDALARKSVGLVVFHAVIEVADARRAERWRHCFEALLERLHAPPRKAAATDGGEDSTSSDVVFALALVYKPMRATALARLRRRVVSASPALARWLLHHPRSFFETAFPRHFDGDLEPFIYPPGSLLTSRLRPAHRQHVDDWYNDPEVRGRVHGATRHEILKAFDSEPERDMGTVLGELALRLQTSPTKAGAAA